MAIWVRIPMFPAGMRMLQLILQSSSCNGSLWPKIGQWGCPGFDVGSESVWACRASVTLVNLDLKTNCKRRTFRTRRLIASEPCNGLADGLGKGVLSNQLPPAARIITSLIRVPLGRGENRVLAVGVACDCAIFMARFKTDR